MKRPDKYILRRAYKKIAVNKLGGKCAKCGNKDDTVFHFHHKHSSVDNTHISYMLTQCKPLDVLLSEIKKCVLLCGNCHLNLHTVKGAQNDRLANKLILMECIGVQGCEDCGYDKNHKILQFHHLREKKFGISRIPLKLLSYDEIPDYIIDEVEKCKVLCPNCHMKIHEDYDKNNEYRERILKKVEKLTNRPV